MRKILGLIWALVISMGPLAMGATVSYVPKYTTLTGEEKPRILLEFRIDGKRAVEVLKAKKGEPFEKTSYELKDASGSAVALQPVAEDVELADSVTLLLGKLLKEERHTFKAKTGKLFADLDGTEIPITEVEIEISADTIKAVHDAVKEEKQSGSYNSIELAGGTEGGTASIRYGLRRDEFLSKSWLNAELRAAADFTLDSDDRTNYFNHLEAGLNFFDSFALWGGYSELGVHATAESDQVFDIVDGKVGVQFAHRIGHFFKIDRALPLFIVGYDYVHNLRREDDVMLNTAGIDTRRADNRIYAIARIRLPIARGYDFSFLPILGGKFDLDIDAEGKILYDINADEFIDKSSISIVFRNTTKERFKPAFSFTWARGKESPTFEQINAFLAGLRLEF